MVQHHADEAIDDPSAVGAMTAIGPMPEAFEAVPELVTLGAPAPLGPREAGPDGRCEGPVCPRAVAATAISKTAQATTVMMTRRRDDFPNIKVSFRNDDDVFLRRIADPCRFPRSPAVAALRWARRQAISKAPLTRLRNGSDHGPAPEH